jgi:hypothetical protein
MEQRIRRCGPGHRSAARRCRRGMLVLGLGIAGATGMMPALAQQLCGGTTYPFPYTDVAAVGAPFCPGIMEAYVTGVSKGTSATTFSPNDTVIRVQMTTFLQRSLDQGLARTSRRTPLNQWWTPQNSAAMQAIGVGFPRGCATDGFAVWANTASALVEVQANNGKILGTWTGAGDSGGLMVAAGRVFLVDNTSPGTLYVIDPSLAPGTLTTAASNLGDGPANIAFDGTNLWTTNILGGSVSIITPQAATPYPPGNVTTVTTGFMSPYGILFDGAHIWITDVSAGKLLKLDPAGAILQTVSVAADPQFPVFDGTNIWVPSATTNSVTVVQASTGNVIATISADLNNRLNGPHSAAFDGERILVTNSNATSVTLFKAADLSFLANVSTGAGSIPTTACSDGINFWITLGGAGGPLLRF